MHGAKLIKRAKLQPIIVFNAVAALALSLFVAWRVWIYSYPPEYVLYERGRYGLLSDRAAMAWVRSGKMIGMRVSDAKTVFGADAVKGGGGTVYIAYDSDILANLRCEVFGTVIKAVTVEVP